MCAGDATSNGMIEVNDYNQINAWMNTSTYDVRGDLDLSGALNVNDLVALNNTGWPTLGWGVLTREGYSDNRKGYAGYEYEPALLGGLYHLRIRELSSERAVFLQRDPLGNIDGLSLTRYAASSPIRFVDPLGLIAASASGCCADPQWSSCLQSSPCCAPRNCNSELITVFSDSPDCRQATHMYCPGDKRPPDFPTPTRIESSKPVIVVVICTQNGPANSTPCQSFCHECVHVRQACDLLTSEGSCGRARRKFQGNCIDMEYEAHSQTRVCDSSHYKELCICQFACASCLEGGQQNPGYADCVSSCAVKYTPPLIPTTGGASTIPTSGCAGGSSFLQGSCSGVGR